MTNIFVEERSAIFPFLFPRTSTVLFRTQGPVSEGGLDRPTLDGVESLRVGQQDGESRVTAQPGPEDGQPGGVDPLEVGEEPHHLLQAVELRDVQEGHGVALADHQAVQVAGPACGDLPAQHDDEARPLSLLLPQAGGDQQFDWDRLLPSSGRPHLQSLTEGKILLRQAVSDVLVGLHHGLQLAGGEGEHGGVGNLRAQTVEEVTPAIWAENHPGVEAGGELGDIGAGEAVNLGLGNILVGHSVELPLAWPWGSADVSDEMLMLRFLFM